MEIRYSKIAQKTIESYDRPTKQRIKAGIEGLTKTPPEGDIKQMQGYTDGRLRLRVGKYRIVYKYDREGNMEILLILDVDSRGDIYKRR
ncbi:MAG: type II toxin-antitoxin system RelE/ParE family toxin [Oscillospiraceae bacterium]|nr:type II toxin-antitoxin system RelE/ParE family toxin [Oscillospiraceae bacterium]